MILKECEQCKKEFKPNHSYNKFCSNKCSGTAKTKPRLEGDCEYCGKHFISKRTSTDWHYTKGGYNLRFCSRGHALASQRKDKVARICKTCGKTFKVFPSVVKNGGGNTCSRECYHKWNSGERHPNWTGGYTEEEYKKRKGRGNKPFRNSILKRDDYTCVMCNTKRAPLEVDHIYPWALFPELRYELNNGRTLCQECHGKTPTWGTRNIKREDFLKGGKLADYTIDALYMIGVKDYLI